MASIFAVPAPVRELFKRFPLHIYDAEPLPARAPSATRALAQLYIFATDDAARTGLPSYNPTCLKWQTYLRVAGLQVALVPSSNHASPSGSLPFLLPASSDSRPDIPLTGDKIAQYASKHTGRAAPAPSARVESYLALVATAIRPAWLHALYVDERHTYLVSRLYLTTAMVLRPAMLHSLRQAATAEILKAGRRPTLDVWNRVYPDAQAAFAALSALLGEDEFFFGGQPGLFDAEVFAYTYLLLDLEFAEDCPLVKAMKEHENLVAHAKRLHARCWGEK